MQSVLIGLIQIEVFLQANWIFYEELFVSWSCKMDNLAALTPIIIIPFNYIDWRDDMRIALRNKGMYRLTVGREFEPLQPLEIKLKYLNKMDEAFGFIRGVLR